MPLRISALQNHLATCEKPFYVRTSHAGTIDYESLADRIAEGRTTITRPDALAVIELLMMEMEGLLAEGYVVKLPFGSFYLVASGTLDGQDQPFVYGDEEHRHDLRLHFRAERSRERRLARRARLVREPIYDHQMAVIMGFSSVKSGDDDPTVARGDYLRIRGQRLKFGPDDPELGVAFRNGTEHASPHYITVTPQSVIAQVPLDLEPGHYTLVLRTRPNDRDVKEAICPGLLVV